MPSTFPMPAAAPGFSPTGMLDAPPANPMIPGPVQAPDTMGGPGRPMSKQLAPEVLQGITQAVNTINGMLDSLAGMVPDLAPDLAFAKNGLAQFQSKVLLAGGGSPTAAQAGTPMPNGLPPSPSPSM
jgi:hypothetical protein